MNQEPSTSKFCPVNDRICHWDFDNHQVACTSKLSDWEGSPPTALLPQTTSKSPNPAANLIGNGPTKAAAANHNQIIRDI